MKHIHFAAIVCTMALVLMFMFVLFGQAAPQQRNPAPIVYEYNVMSVMDLFADAPNAEQVMKKIMKLGMANRDGSFHRTDMDVPDYEEALNRIAEDGWELVTVNKSNYWVFRRPKQ